MCGEVMHIFYLIVVSCNVSKTVSNSFNFHFISAFFMNSVTFSLNFHFQIILEFLCFSCVLVFVQFQVIFCYLSTFVFAVRQLSVVYLTEICFFCVADAVPIKNMIHVKGQTVFKTVSCQYVM